MEIILRKNIKNLGQAGDLKQVKDGYGRNYLIPHGLVEPATPGAIKNWKLGEERRKKRLEKELQAYKKTAEKMNGLTLSYTRKVTDEETIFGSIGKTDIIKSLKSSGFEVSKDNINLDTPVKKIGETEIPIVLRQGASCSVKIKIVPKK